MAELKDFENFIKDKSANTIKSYKQQYNKLKKIVDTQMEQSVEIQNVSEKNILEFVIEENKRTRYSSVEISKSNIKEFGKLMYQSHKGLRKLYEVSCEELDFLVDFSKSKKEVIGSRMMGGGFGGCTINLIRGDYVDDFISSVSKAYLKKFNIEPSPLFVNIGDGVTIKTT